MKRTISVGICLILTVVTLFISTEQTLQARQSVTQAPVKFQYGGDSKFKNEDSKYYIYVYCNKYEGTTCTNPDGAVRIELPRVSASLLRVNWD